MAERTLDEQAAAVAKAVRDAFRAVLDDRLAALVIHGSAVTGYIPRFSDFDFEAFFHGPLRPEDALDIGARLQRVELGPFAYLQLSRVIDVDDPGARMAGLIDDAYAVACGALPATWAFHSEAVLRERGREAIERIPSAVATCVEDATTARGDRHYRVVRYLATVLKPALRGLLAECSEPVLDVWRAPHDDLAERWRRYDPAGAETLEMLIGRLPPETAEIDDVALMLFGLLERISADAAQAKNQEPKT